MDIAGQYFDCLCRTCMTELCEASSYDGKTKPQQWQSLFDRISEECGALQIAELLTNALPQIEVQPSDELPKKICFKCLQQLLSVHRFQQMCLQSDQQLRQRVPKKHNDLSAAMEGDPNSCLLGSFQSSSTHQNIDNSSVQEPLETAEQEVKPEVTEANDVDIDQLLEDCRDSQGNLSEFIKNEPIEDNDQQLQKQNDEPDMEDNDEGVTIQSIISGKDAVMAIESEAQQENEPNLKDEDKPYECPYCPQRFAVKSSYYRHKATHENGETRQLCEVCGKIIRKGGLKEHKLIHSDEKAHKCDFCEKSFTKIWSLHCHMRTHLGYNVHRCELCPLAFPAASEQRAHFTTHENEDSETRKRNMKALKEAEAEIKAKENIKKHHSRHAEDKPYKCPYCKRTFNTISNMDQHKARHEVACDICGKTIVKNNLKKHKLTHSNEKAHKCDFCGKRFNRITCLRIHIRTHTGEKPYKCNYCERSFHDRSNHISHLRVHFGDNIYRCELCPLAFPAAINLRAHSTEHKNEDSETRERNIKALQEAEVKLQLGLSKEHKPVQKTAKCDFCGKCFTVMPALRRHMRQHTGEKPYKCKYCERSFVQSSILVTHMRVHLGDNIYRCELCPLAFPLAKELRAHLTQHSNDDSETRERNMKALKEAEAKLQLKLSETETQRKRRAINN